MSDEHDETRLIPPTPAPNDPTMLTPPVSGSRPSHPNAETVAIPPSQGSSVSRPVSASAAARSAAGPAAGMRRVGDYDLESEIARGGMGIVYRARQLSLNRPVAFKMILAGQFASDADVERFQVEAEAAAGLDHPNIVPIYEVGAFEGNHFFTMKLIDGRSMAHEMPRLVTAPRDGVRLLVKVCRAIHYAHQHSILHRDLKPANILLDAQGEPHVTDFGLAKRTGPGDSQLTQTGTIVGTPSYMAPEQAAPSKIPLTTAADVYSLGAMLYEVLTGRPPFKGDSPLDTLMLVLNKEPERPRTINASVDSDLETIALKCLEKDPARRYGSAEALAEDLDRWLAGEPILARPIGSAERVMKWAKRRPAIAALAVAMAVVTVLGVAGVVWQWREAVYQRGQAADALVRVAQEAKAAGLARDQEAAQRSAADEARSQETIARQKADEQKAIAVTALGVAERNAYFNDISLADHEWAGANIGHVDQLLAATPASFRNWEWGYLKRLSHNEQSHVTLGKNVAALVVDAPGGHATVVTSDLAASFIDLRTGHVDRRVSFSGATGSEIMASAMSADGGRFGAVTLRFDKNAIRYETTVWDTATGRPVFSQSTAMLTVPLTALALSADGTKLVGAGFDMSGLTSSSTTQPSELVARLSATGSRLNVWDLRTSQEQPSLGAFSGRVSGLSFSRDGSRLTVASSGAAASSPTEIRVIDAVTGRAIGAVVQATDALVFSPDGQWIAGASAKGVRVLSAAGGQQRWALPEAATNVVTYSPSGETIAAALADRSIVVLDARTGALRGRFFGSASPISSLLFAGSERRLLSADAESLRTFTIGDDAAPLVAGGAADTLVAAAVTPDGRRLVGIERGILHGWDLATGRVLYGPADPSVADTPANATAALIASSLAASAGQLSPPQNRMVFGPGGLVMALVKIVQVPIDGRPQARQSLRVFDTTTGAELRAFNPAPDAAGSKPSPSPVGALTMSTPTVTAAALDRTGVHATLATLATVVSLSSGRGAGAGQPQTQSGVSFLGSHLDLWSVAGERPLRSLTLENTIVASAEIAPDGRYLAMLSANVSADGQGALYRVYRVASGEIVASFPGDRQSGPIAFSPDSRFVAAETPRHTVTIWNLDANRPVILAQHRSAVTRIAFSPDGTRIATLSSEGITLFDARAGTQLLVLRESSGPFRVREVLVPGKIFTGVTTLAFSDDGRQIIETVMSPDAKGIRVQIKTWDGARN